MDPNKRPDDMVRITTPELAQAFIKEQIAAIREQIGSKKVLLAPSGGVDSSVVAALLIKAIGKQLICVHVNHGLMRKGESEQVVDVFKNQMDANLAYVDATDRFLDKLVDVEEPVNMVERQPLPGPGLGVRCLGAITRDRLKALREADAIVREEIDKAGLTIWQYFAVVPDFRATGIRDGKRAYDWPCIIRCINTVDVMTAEVPSICRVCYDLTPKPVGTVEWE